MGRGRDGEGGNTLAVFPSRASLALKANSFSFSLSPTLGADGDRDAVGGSRHQYNSGVGWRGRGLLFSPPPHILPLENLRLLASFLAFERGDFLGDFFGVFLGVFLGFALLLIPRSRLLLSLRGVLKTV